ncbi:MAG TPA: hypothetical protein PKB14_02630 [Rubrivivax sp.]|mgnify:CR=1 FL=1|nr:hypothetical protein [Rubrivivax sp.]
MHYMAHLGIKDASKVKKDFFLKEEVTGKVTEWDQDRYAITFTKV